VGEAKDKFKIFSGGDKRQIKNIQWGRQKINLKYSVGETKDKFKIFSGGGKRQI